VRRHRLVYSHFTKKEGLALQISSNRTMLQRRDNYMNQSGLSYNTLAPTSTLAPGVDKGSVVLRNFANKR
jgi:hypothetical protein